MSKRPWNRDKAVLLLPQWVRDTLREQEEEIVRLKTELVQMTGGLDTNLVVHPPAPSVPFGIPPRSAVAFHMDPDGRPDPFNRDRIQVSVKTVKLRDALHHSLSVTSIRPMFIAPQAPTHLIIDLGGPDE